MQTLYHMIETRISWTGFLWGSRNQPPQVSRDTAESGSGGGSAWRSGLSVPVPTGPTIPRMPVPPPWGLLPAPRPADRQGTCWRSPRDWKDRSAGGRCSGPEWPAALRSSGRNQRRPGPSEGAEFLFLAWCLGHWSWKSRNTAGPGSEGDGLRELPRPPTMGKPGEGPEAGGSLETHTCATTNTSFVLRLSTEDVRSSARPLHMCTNDPLCERSSPRRHCFVFSVPGMVP